jgi:DNA-binding MarR family transcriptional regulator
MDRTTLTANLKPLERRGLIRVTVDDADKRSRRLVLSSAGCSALAAAMPFWKQTEAAIEDSVSDADRFRADLLALS